MSKTNKVFMLVLFLVVIIVFAKLYVSQTHYFSFTNLTNHNNGLVRDVSSYIVEKKLNGMSLEEKKDTFLEILFPSSLNLPSGWRLSSEAINVFCDSIITKDKNEKEFILYNVAHTASLYKNLEVLKFLNQFGDIKRVFLEFEKPFGATSYEKLDELSKRVISSGDVGELKCHNKLYKDRHF